jgi:hypothetical protein
MAILAAAKASAALPVCLDDRIQKKWTLDTSDHFKYLNPLSNGIIEILALYLGYENNRALFLKGIPAIHFNLMLKINSKVLFLISAHRFLLS